MGNHRTNRLGLPKHPPYQLGYTRIQDIKFVGMWSNMWSEEFYHKFPELSRGESGDICGDSGLVPIFSERWRKRSPGSQTRRPTSWATPGNGKKNLSAYQKRIIHQLFEKSNYILRMFFAVLPQFLQNPHGQIPQTGVKLQIYLIKYTAYQIGPVGHKGGFHITLRRAAAGEKTVLL